MVSETITNYLRNLAERVSDGKIETIDKWDALQLLDLADTLDDERCLRSGHPTIKAPITLFEKD